MCVLGGMFLFFLVHRLLASSFCDYAIVDVIFFHNLLLHVSHFQFNCIKVKSIFTETILVKKCRVYVCFLLLLASFEINFDNFSSARP